MVEIISNEYVVADVVDGVKQAISQVEDLINKLGFKKVMIGKIEGNVIKDAIIFFGGYAMLENINKRIRRVLVEREEIELDVDYAYSYKTYHYEVSEFDVEFMKGDSTIALYNIAFNVLAIPLHPPDREYVSVVKVRSEVEKVLRAVLPRIMNIIDTIILPKFKERFLEKLRKAGFLLGFVDRGSVVLFRLPRIDVIEAFETSLDSVVESLVLKYVKDELQYLMDTLRQGIDTAIAYVKDILTKEYIRVLPMDKPLTMKMDKTTNEIIVYVRDTYRPERVYYERKVYEVPTDVAKKYEFQCIVAYVFKYKGDELVLLNVYLYDKLLIPVLTPHSDRHGKVCLGDIRVEPYCFNEPFDKYIDKLHDKVRSKVLRSVNLDSAYWCELKEELLQLIREGKLRPIGEATWEVI